MKYRVGFVTNSSSSSYLCVFKVDICPELKGYMREEYGKYGLRLMNEEIMTMDELCQYLYEDRGWDDRKIEDSLGELDSDGHYLAGDFVAWTTEGDSDSDGAILSRYIPDEYIDMLYEGDCD